MKASSFFVTILLSILILSGGCSNSGSKLKIGFSMRSLSIDRCKQEKKFFSERMTQLGGELLFAEANDNDQVQIQQSIEMLDKGVDVLVVFPVNQNTSAAIVREAHKRNVKVIAYESLIQNCDLDYYITADNHKGGKLMAEYIQKLAPKGNYVLLGGDKADRNAILIKTGNHEVLDPMVTQGRIKIIYDIYADWTAEEGYQEIKKVLDLSGTTPDAIISSNDGLATGIIKALSEYGLSGKIPVTGLDGELAACQRIAKGTQTLTIFKSLKKQAYAAADMAFQIASGKKVENIDNEVFNGTTKVPSYLIDPTLVDKNNLREIIVKNNVYSEKEVYGSN